ncbi:Cof-type HAD-IIB family hydrolase [uncultured Maribacter sp.]|uniref:Cof-type HAD-IIB family hydrolase n=1 Tax=uncultured Maribacter sp. TaxID=431308 RepID=UPI002622FCFB|nr:Cof-type HAD-IIB family hydrolase [uncultured Maribacter sp.]
MTYKILCSDLDGTLLTTKSDVSNFTISQIERVKERMQIILVSARMPKAMHYIQQDLGVLHEPIICYNGALILHGDKELKSTVIPALCIENIHKIAEQHNIKLGLYYKDEWYAEIDSERIQKEKVHTKVEPVFKNTTETILDWKLRKIGAHKIMLMGTKNTADIAYKKLEESFSEEINIYRSNDTLIEVSPKSVSKLSAITYLIKDKYTLDDIISFGDNYNDIDMLQNTGCGVAVGNAREEAKRISNYVTLKNTEDGVAHYVKENLFN